VFRGILERAAFRGIPTVLDSYGPALRSGLKGRPTIIKLNRAEYESTFGVRLNRGLHKALGAFLRRTGAEACILTDGAEPVVGMTPDLIVTVLPPRVKVINPTGSGDSMLAGILYGLLRGWQFPRALQFGAAAGAANASRWDVAVARTREIRTLAERTKVFQQPFSINRNRRIMSHARTS
jgi:fructose-1-phosphate kinase PfkB-like protein